MNLLVKNLPGIVAIVGFGFFLVGLATYFGADKPQNNIGFSPSVIERQAAIKSSIEKGQATYSYQSNFIPGLGRVGAAEQLRDRALETPIE